MKKLTIVKIGGEILDDKSKLAVFLKDFSSIPGLKILVHGGGKMASSLSKELGVDTKLVDGRRLTDKDVLPITIMVYAGLINKTVVADLQSYNCDAVGLCGADAGLITTTKRKESPINYGYVGDCQPGSINVKRIIQLLNLGICPVFSAITMDDKGQLLNTNADTIASCLSVALAEYFKVSLLYCFEHSGVLRDLTDANSIIPELTSGRVEALKESRIIKTGMLPKIENALHAALNGVQEIRIKDFKSLLIVDSGTLISSKSY